MIRLWALPALFMAWALLLFLPYSALYGRARALVLGGGAGVAARGIPPGYVWRAAAALTAVGVAAWSLTTFVNSYEHGLCIDDVGSREFLLPPVLFSISLIWLFSEAIMITSINVFQRPMGRLQALALGLLVHFTFGTLAWLIYPDVAYQRDGPWDGAPEWIPMWIIGLMYEVGHFGVCH